MLGVSSYTKEYVESCRSRIQAQIDAYATLIGESRKAGAASPKKLDAAAARFEPLFFNHMVLVLDEYFVHRLRGKEGKDGNAMNEVRVIASSIMDNDGVFTPEKSIRLTAERSLLGYAEGDQIALSEEDFRRLATAFIGEIASKFT